MQRKTLLHAALALCLPLLAASAGAQTPAAAAADFPSKPVRIIVGLGPGSSLDLIARALGPHLANLWNRPVIIDNRIGAAGNVAADVVSRADDGHTLLLAQNAITISASLYPNLPYNLRKSLKPVTQVTSMPHVIVVSTAMPATLAGFLAEAKAHPGKLNFSSAGIGNADHMAAELLNTKAGVQMVHVPYTSGAQALTAVMAGDAQMYFPGLPVSLPAIKAGKVRALAVTSATRSPSLPDVPTAQEAGVPGYQTVLWYGLFAPASMPGATVHQIAADVHKVLQLPETRASLASTGVDLVGNSPEEFTAFVNSEIDRWAEVVKARNLRPE
ncbi:MAG: tripartite tricarboxylate transporter substrate binding protein [Pseudomonadota bacterium]